VDKKMVFTSKKSPLILILQRLHSS